MAYVIYAKGLSRRFEDFEEELLSDLARRGVNISNHRSLEGGVAMSVEYTDEEGEMTMAPEQADIKISYSATGGPETLKGAITGGATGGGLGVLTSILTGRSDKDKIAAGVAGAISGGALGAYRGQEKGMREKISFARLLAMTVTGAERKLLNMEKQAMLAQSKSALNKENLMKEKLRLEAQLEQMRGTLESAASEEESKKIAAESRHIDRSTQLEAKYVDKKELLEKLLASEEKRYESELKQIESNYGRRKSLFSSRITETEARIKLLESKLEGM